jgi:hypothetical protein
VGQVVHASSEILRLQIGMPFVAEAMEVLGGIGYCEESELPRLYREMPVNSIWEGSGNIMCLDVLRVLTKQPGIYDMLSEAFAEVKGKIGITIEWCVSYSSVYVNPVRHWDGDYAAAFPARLRGADVALFFSASGAGLVPNDA